MSKTTIIARTRSDGTVVRVLDDGTEQPFPLIAPRELTDDEVEAAAAADPDARPMTIDERARARRVPRVKTLRRALGLTQEDFAARYHLPLGTLRDWEQGRSEPDQAAQAYIRAIAGNPEAVRRALDEGAAPRLSGAPGGGMQNYFVDKVAIVTGAASGVGLALAAAMLAQGVAVVALLDIDDAALARETRRLSADHPGRVVGRRCDVTSEAEVRQAIEAVAATAGRADLLFNNAGAGFGGRFEDQTDAAWARAFALNFYGPLYAIRAVLPIMRGQGGGHIVNIVSGIAFAPMAQQTMYAATKAALNSLSLALRYELWDDGIRVTSATPGTTATAIWGAGGKTVPSHAQSASEAARTILEGVARNDRLVLGDARDADGAANAFDPAAAEGMDAYLLDVARRRRKGETAV